MSDEKLQQMDVFLIREQVAQELGRYAKIFGVANVAAIIGIFFAVQAQVSAQMNAQVDKQVANTVSLLRPELTNEITNALKTATRVQATYEQLAEASEALKTQQSQLQIDFRNLGSEKAAQAARVIAEIGDAKTGNDLLQQLNAKIDQLRTSLVTTTNEIVRGSLADVGTDQANVTVDDRTSSCGAGTYAVGIEISPVGVTTSGGRIGRAAKTVQVICKPLNVGM